MNDMAKWLLLILTILHLADGCPVATKNANTLKEAAEEHFSDGELDVALLCLRELLVFEVGLCTAYL